MINPDRISDLALNKMNIASYGFEFGTNTRNGMLVGYIGEMPYNGDDTHRAFYLSMQDSLKPFYNPGITNNSISSQDDWMPVYFYWKSLYGYSKRK